MLQKRHIIGSGAVPFLCPSDTHFAAPHIHIATILHSSRIVPQKSLHFCGTMRVRSGESPRELVLDLVQPDPPLLVPDLLDHVEADPADVVDADLVERAFDE